MSLYNMMCGNNPLFTLLHAILATAGELPEIPRYRDTYTKVEDGQPFIVIYTRTGGGNRHYHAEQNAALFAHPLCCGDHDDDFDSTFAHFEFAVPDAWEARVVQVHKFMSRTPKGQTPGQKFKRTMASLTNESTEVLTLPTDEECDVFAELIQGMASELGL